MARSDNAAGRPILATRARFSTRSAGGLRPPPATGSRRRSPLRPTRRPGLAGHRRRRTHAHLCAHRLGQDAGRLPVVPRPADARAAARDPLRRLRVAVRLAAQGARPRCRTATCARRWPGIALAARTPGRVAACGAGGHADRRHSGRERRAFGKRPPDILVTTPESLYLMLTSAGSRGPARRRLGHHRRDPRPRRHQARRPPRRCRSNASRHSPRRPPQRIGLSATQRPLERRRRLPRRPRRRRRSDRRPARRGRCGSSMPASARTLEIEVVVPVEDMAAIGEMLPPDRQPGGSAAAPDARSSIWPAIQPRILELIRAHRSTIVFVNSRRLAERLALRLNELAGEELVRAHHGSLAREQRLEHRGAAQGRPAAGHGGHLQSGAGHRHGRRRPRHPGRVAGLGRSRPAAHRPGGPPGGRAIARA